MTKTEFQQRINYIFRDESLLDIVLNHSSFVMENGMQRAECNERLEFLGDAFFDAVIAEALYEKYPTASEGFLSKTRTSIVCESSLADLGEKIGIGELLKLGHGAENLGGRECVSIIADATEALIGAIYKDGGYEVMRRWILEMFGAKIESGVIEEANIDYKTLFQEEVQQNGPVDIEYKLLRTEGPDHEKIFFVELRVNGKLCGKGIGRSKKAAEKMAAKDAMTNRS